MTRDETAKGQSFTSLLGQGEDVGKGGKTLEHGEEEHGGEGKGWVWKKKTESGGPTFKTGVGQFFQGTRQGNKKEVEPGARV